MQLSHLFALLALQQVADGAGIVPLGSFYDETAINHQHSSNTPVFPWLTRLRDGVIELLFGRHPTKDNTQFPDFGQLRAQYTNEIVLRFNVSTTDEEGALSKAAARLFLDVWAFTDEFVDVRLHADEVSPLLSLLPKSLHTSHSILIPDLATAVYEAQPLNGDAKSITSERVYADLSGSRNGAGDNLFFQDYQSLSVIVRWMRLLEAMFPSYVRYVPIGQSFEGRDIPALRLGVPAPSSPDNPRKTILVTGGLHAREWISTTTVNYVAWSFITSFGKEPMITKLLDEFDIVFMPVVNPDGFEYTWHVDRLWRKSRQQTNLRYCRGLDLDHAFGYEWDSAIIESDPCSESYGGEQPFQAIEAQRLADWARNETLHDVKFVGLLDLHSYSQQVLFPYAFSCASDPPNLENLEELGAGIAKAIRISNGESYMVTSACEGAVAAQESDRNRDEIRPRIESGGGSAIDWFYHEMRAHYSYQIKLRDTGSYGFLLPRDQIVPTGEEIFNAVKYFGDYLLGNNGIEGMLGEETALPVETELDDDTEATNTQELKRRRFYR